MDENKKNINIIEFDFKITKSNYNYILHLKNKKGTYVLNGYYSNLINPLKIVRKYRRSKKYPFKNELKNLDNINDYILKLSEIYKKVDFKIYMEKHIIVLKHELLWINTK